MPIIHKNCFDEEYFLHEGKTKTGKPKYFFSKKKNGDDLPDTIPDGYEIYERPGGMVYLRKFQKTPILKEELEYVQKKIAGMVNCGRDQEMTGLRKLWGIGFPGFHDGNSNRLAKMFHNRFQAEIKKNEIIVYEVQSSNAMPILKFALVDENKRSFSACRCYLSSVGFSFSFSSSVFGSATARR